MNTKQLCEQLGTKIKTIRKRFHFTQEFFSEKIGIEPQNLSRIERGLNYPSLSTFIRICEVLNITPNDLLELDYITDEQTLDENINKLLQTQTFQEKQLTYRLIKLISR